MIKLENKKTKKIVPVNIDSLSAEDWELFNSDQEISYRSGEHISHFKTCTDPDRFSSKKKENKS